MALENSAVIKSRITMPWGCFVSFLALPVCGRNAECLPRGKATEKNDLSSGFTEQGNVLEKPPVLWLEITFKGLEK